MGEFAIGQGGPPVSRTRGSFLAAASIVGRHRASGQRPSVTCSALRTPTPGSRASTHKAAEAAPRRACVLTGKDWIESGWATCRFPARTSSATASKNYQPPYPALVKDTVRFVGDYVAFVVAETKNQAMDASELIEVDYETAAGRSSRPRTPTTHGAPRGVAGLQEQHLLHPDPRRQGEDRSGLREGRACRESIASRHQPRDDALRWSRAARLGDYNRTDRSLHDLHHAAARASVPRRACAARAAGAGAQGARDCAATSAAAFGMKSAIYNEVAAGAAGLEERSGGR